MIKFLKRIIRKYLPDSICLRYLFYARMGYRLNLREPKTFNEKLQWLKLHDHNPLYTVMADKYLVKDYVARIIGKEYIIPTLGVYNNFDEIDFDKLPDYFVLKCNHDSGSIIICKDKKKFSKEYAKTLLTKALKINYYNYSKERVYKNIKPKIIAEKYMVDESGDELKDYKVFCFDGEPYAIQVDFDRFSNHKRNIYNLKWDLLPFELQYPSDKNYKIEKPKCLKKLLELAKKLSQQIPHVRIDFYIIKGKIFFGEMTFYHGAGFEEFKPKERDYKLGNLIKLPK